MWASTYTFYGASLTTNLLDWKTSLCSMSPRTARAAVFLKYNYFKKSDRMIINFELGSADHNVRLLQ